MRAALLVFVAVIGSLALGAASAGAVEWLDNGNKIAGSQALSVSGPLLLDETTNKIEIVCETVGTGTVGPGAADSITGLTLANCLTLVGGCEKDEVTALELPWKTEVQEPKAGESRDFIANGGKGEPAYLVKCELLGNIKQEVSCAGQTSVVLGNVFPDVLGLYDVKSETLSCGFGIGNTVVSGEILYVLGNKDPLAFG